MIARNIPLAYILTVAKHSWFWLGILLMVFLAGQMLLGNFFKSRREGALSDRGDLS